MKTEKLKTLNDIYPYKEDKFGKYYKDKDLKAEAIKWVKANIEQVNRDNLIVPGNYIADIECAKKYLSDKEKKEFEGIISGNPLIYNE